MQLLELEHYSRDSIDRLRRARNVLSGLDDFGVNTHPEQFDEKVISFADGEGIRRPHPDVLVAGLSALLETNETSLEKYYFRKRLQDLDDKIAEFFINEGIDEESARNIAISAGTSHLFNAFFNSVAEPGDIFLTSPGFYHSLVSWCEINRVNLQCLPFNSETQNKLSVSDLEKWIRDHPKKPKGLILFNPTYTGDIYTSHELMELADFVDKNDLVVLEDSIFMYTAFEETDKVHLSSFPNMKDRVITLNGGSKAYGLANMRIGWCCGAKHIIDRMNYYIGATLVDPPHVAKMMALAALNTNEKYLKVNKEELQKRVRLIVDLIDQANVQLNTINHNFSTDPIIEIKQVPKSGHSILLSLNNLVGLDTHQGYTIKDSIDITRYFLSDAYVAVGPGLSHGFNDCTIRLSYGCVGLKHTYQEVIEIEQIMLLKELMNRFNKTDLLNHLQQEWNLSNEVIKKRYETSHVNGFSQGRKLIKEAIMNRMVPSISRLIIEK